MGSTSCDRTACFLRRPGFAKANAFGLRSACPSDHWGQQRIPCREIHTACVLLLLFCLPVRLILLVLHVVRLFSGRTKLLQANSASSNLLKLPNLTSLSPKINILNAGVPENKFCRSRKLEQRMCVIRYTCVVSACVIKIHSYGRGPKWKSTGDSRLYD